MCGNLLYFVGLLALFIFLIKFQQHLTVYTKNRSSLLGGTGGPEPEPPYSTSAQVVFQSSEGNTHSFVTNDVNWNPYDQHNVHNITISNSIHERLAEVENELDKQSHNLGKIKDFYHKNGIRLLGKKNKVAYVLSYLEHAQARYSPKKYLETQILNWIFLQARSSHQSELTLKELGYQIDNCYDREDSCICCLEGRIVRYFQALSLDEEQNVKVVPIWYYKNEIENHCARELDKMIGAMPKEKQQIYFASDLTDHASNWIKETNQALIDKLETYFRQEYQDLKSDQLREITKPCYEAIQM